MPFTHPPPEERGLGFSVVYGFVFGLEGSLRIEFTVGSGTCVTVCFLVQAPEPEIR